MRDLGRAVSEAAATFVAERMLRIPVLACHLHFPRDIGKDLMRPAHDELREQFRHFNVLAQVRPLARATPGRSRSPSRARACSRHSLGEVF